MIDRTKNTQGEDEYEEIEVPDCFSFYDAKDPSCRRCKLMSLCIEEQEGTRPPCFGELYDAASPECAACIDASQCLEAKQMEEMKMAKRKKVRIRRTVPKKAPEPEPEPEPENGDYATWKVVDLRAELEDRGLDVAGRKSVLVARLAADDAGEDVEVSETEEPETTSAAEGSLADLFELMHEGSSLVVTRMADGWHFSEAGPVAPPAPQHVGVTGSAFEKEAYSEEFYEWFFVDCGTGKSWHDMTAADRAEMAEEIGAEWEEHDNPKTNAMRMGLAVRVALGIEKWKPQYQSRAARKALKELGVRA